MSSRQHLIRWILSGAFALAILTVGSLATTGQPWLGGIAAAESASSVRPPKNAVNVEPKKPGVQVPSGKDTQKWGAGGKVPTTVSPQPNSAEYWRRIRAGIQGGVSIPDTRAGTLVQTAGMNWVVARQNMIGKYGGWLLLATVVLLALFFALRRRIPIDGGPSGKEIERFAFWERFAHWLTASTFIILGTTGLIILYGRELLIPLLGKEAFAVLAELGKVAHNYLAFPFMLGILMMVVLWIRHNLPDKYDLPWLMKGGGLFSDKSHPAAKKFNAGQKFIFWSVVIGGIALSVTGLLLMFFPAKGNLADLMNYQMLHAIISLVMIAIILAHIYIGSLGMKGAFQAMGSGMVDENWAKQHHSVWVEETKGAKKSSGAAE